MAGYTTVNYEDVAPKAEAMHFLRDSLDCENLGVTVVDVEDEWEGKAHEHAESDHEEVYLLIEGSATLTIGDEAVALDTGDAVRVAPETTRQLSISDGGTVVIAGAP